MPFVYTGLPRSERLLPLESIEVLDSTDSFLLHILSRQSNSGGDTGDEEWHSKRLREHLSLYWVQHYAHYFYQLRLLRAVRSTRGPVRFVGFPHVRTDPKGTNVAPPGPGAPASGCAQSSGASPLANGGSSIPPQPSAEAAAAAASPPRSAEGTLLPPRSLAAWNWISLVAPYERLLCPSLLYSALLSPSVGGYTSVYYGSQQLSPAAEAVSIATVAGHARARWSARTCQSMWALHSVAAGVSVPLQEVYVMCSGTIMYLDVVLTTGTVWSELEGMWGSELVLELEREKASMQTRVPSSSESETRTQLSSLKALLSQPPPTYAAMLQHVRVLLEALTQTSTESKSTNALAAPEAVSAALPRPLVPWLEAAMAKEKWTASADPWTGSSSSGSDASSVVERILRYAVAECLSRRGATVTAATPTGSRAAPLPPRDLCLPRGSSLGASSLPKFHVCSECTSASLAPSVRWTGAHRQYITTARSAGAATAAASITFEPFEPHDTPRDQHPFSLPPLPQDPALIFFTVVWRRTLQRCILEPDALRQRLRQVVLGYAGQRCEELLREAKQHSLQPCASVKSSTTAESSADPPSTKALAGRLGMTGKSGTAPNRARAAASLSSSLHLPAAAAPSPPLLLTCDPTATSFRVLGPRVGEWVTSSRGGGGWSGFRGELFYCVGPPPLPLVYSPCMSGPRAAQARFCSPPSLGTPPSSAAASAPPAKVLTEVFVDGALEVDRAGGISTASPANPASRLPPLLHSVEELADRLCRLGAVLPRYATEVCGHRLRPADSDFVREVLQRHCLPLLLACERRGIQQWGLRSWMKGITLTLLDKSGVESRVITPAKLVELGLQQARSVGGPNVFATATALRMVMDGGLSEALAFLEHVQKRPERTVRRLPVRRLVADIAAISGNDVSAAAAAPLQYISTAVDVLLLRRSEESAFFRIYQSHPSALLLAGCGVQRLALPVTTAAPERRHEGGGGHLHPPGSSILLLRTCGVAVDWDLQDCYERPRLSRLREPRRLVSHPHRKDTTSGGMQWLPLPPELGTAVERVSLQHMRRMLQYYLRSLKTAAGLSGASDTTGGVPPASGVKRSRTELEKEKERPDELLSIADERHAECKTGAESPVSLPPADPSSGSVAHMLRTTVFPIDRAALLYVLRHHPQYHRQVKGCGIRQVYVAAATLSSEESIAVAARANVALDRTGALTVAETTSADPYSSAAAGSHRAAVIVERVCGQTVEVDVEACYDKAREGRPLRPFVMLA
ncbi:hypothetical protein GH5_02424 [Leishmania sp. Ghana 2012 LV757]|uniref:hypothetical protein n=1 Tax=Leishmania sp. Ghana 2012 LV757 TaxID=2803181 RepID=UPI001B41A943|nr:hypothetical protein GH5_02424 [Leishmania sp. Ghana 2012 LV757]